VFFASSIFHLIFGYTLLERYLEIVSKREGESVGNFIGSEKKVRQKPKEGKDQV
jgi:hypothetical protein